jgi:hypothetical protein
MKKITFEIEVSPWLNRRRTCTLTLYAGDSVISETELNFTLQELVDDEINANTVHGKLQDP